MDVLPLTLVLSIIFGWCLLARLLQRAGLTAPIVFVAAGLVLAEGLEVLDLALEPHLVKVIAEVTLVWVLFADASRVRPSQFRRDLGLYGRLLGVGLPLTVALGTAAALVVLETPYRLSSAGRLASPSAQEGVPDAIARLPVAAAEGTSCAAPCCDDRFPCGMGVVRTALVALAAVAAALALAAPASAAPQLKSASAAPTSPRPPATT